LWTTEADVERLFAVLRKTVRSCGRSANE